MEKQVHNINNNNNNNYYKHGNDEDEDAFLGCLVACGSNVLRMVLKASIKLDLFEIIDKSSHFSALEIASQLHTRDVEGAARMLDFMLGVLVTQSFLTCSTTDHASTTELRYGLAPKGKLLVSDERGVSLAQFYALTVQQESTNMFIPLEDAVLEGGYLFEKANGAQPFYEHMASNPESNKIFNDAMGCVSTPIMKRILKVYNGFEGLRTIVDVGGGNGTTLNMITTEHTWIKGINFDSPEVIQTAPTYEGVKHVGGDMFVEVPKGDAIILKAVLHNWGDEECVKLLKNCYKALPKKGKVIVIEFILPEIPQTDVNSQQLYLMSIIMLSLNGKERTKGEYEALAAEAGFAEFKVASRAYGASVMELVKF
ncbi:caffeic acid 3-O-methyltransferase-like [Henckelia pumila]|uniref:caffeic acid 3-O-methyltransferase-like n=1 Tax=Henckelia pumila TaxID=405737 RepID=UPI003C6DD1C9